MNDVVGPMVPSPTVAEFEQSERVDSNAWWRLGSGDHQNLFDEATEQRDWLWVVIRKAWPAIPPAYCPGWLLALADEDGELPVECPVGEFPAGVG